MSERQFLQEFEPGKVTILKNDNKGPSLPVIKKEIKMTLKETEDKVMADFTYAKKAGSPLSLADYKKANQIDPKDKVAFRFARDEYGFQGTFEDFVKAKSKK